MIAHLVIGLGIELRFLLFRKFYEDWKAKKLPASILNYSGQLLIGTGWAIHFGSIFNTYGPNSFNTSNTLIIIAGIITGASISSVAHKASFHALTGAMFLPLLALYLTTPEADKSVVVYIFLFYIFNTYNINLANRQLVRSIENEVRARNEEERILKIIDTVPGYVAVLDADLICTLANKKILEFHPDLVGNKITDEYWGSEIVNFLQSDKQHTVAEVCAIIDGKEEWVL